MNFLPLLLIILFFLIGVILTFKPKLNVCLIYALVFIFAGPLVYFNPEYSQIRWGIDLLSLALLFRGSLGLITLFSSKKNTPIPSYMVIMVIFFIFSLAPSIYSGNFKESILDFKNYYQFWSIPLIYYATIDDDKLVRNLLIGFIFIAMLNVPLGCVQYILKGPNYPGDAVTGTFGGTVVTGTGPNQAFSLFLILQIGFSWILAINKKLKTFYAIVLTFIFITPVALANAKASVIFFVILVLFIFKNYIITRPFLSIVMASILLLLVSFVFYFHFSEINKYGQKYTASVDEYVDRTLNYNLNTEVKNINRLTAITFWYSENVNYHGLIKLLIGHGIGSSRTQGGINEGYLNKLNRYRGLSLAPSSLARLLWDVGLIGAALYLVIFIISFFDANKLYKCPQLTTLDKSILMYLQISIIFIIGDFPYKDSHFSVQSYNAFIMFILASISYYKKKLYRDGIRLTLPPLAG